jgi:uncharacterized membrane protein
LRRSGDGVFAIAITLLILEVAVPRAAFGDLWRGIGDQWPSYLAYATSFITIGGIWLAHHAIFRRLRYANSHVMRANLGLLMAVSFLPFPTKLMAEAISDTHAERAAVIFYGATVLVISLLFSALVGAISRDRELLEPEVSEREIRGDPGRLDPQPCLLRRGDFARSLRTQSCCVWLPRHRDRRCTTGHATIRHHPR